MKLNAFWTTFNYYNFTEKERNKKIFRHICALMFLEKLRLNIFNNNNNKSKLFW